MMHLQSQVSVDEGVPPSYFEHMDKSWLIGDWDSFGTVDSGDALLGVRSTRSH